MKGGIGSHFLTSGLEADGWGWTWIWVFLLLDHNFECDSILVQAYQGISAEMYLHVNICKMAGVKKAVPFCPYAHIYQEDCGVDCPTHTSDFIGQPILFTLAFRVIFSHIHKNTAQSKQNNDSTSTILTFYPLVIVITSNFVKDFLFLRNHTFVLDPANRIFLHYFIKRAIF